MVIQTQPASSTRTSDVVVVIIGSGGRETALAWKLSKESAVKQIHVFPGNGYTSSGAIQKTVKLEGKLDFDPQEPSGFPAFAKWCEESCVDLVVIGPEAPLAAGLVDYLDARGIACFGPSKLASELEWNKAFAKEFFDKYGIPTARWKTFTTSSEAIDFIQRAPFEALVVKAAGLAAGKGVIVAENRDEACQAVKFILDEKQFADAGATVVIEERLFGPEVSVMCFTDGYTVVPMPAVQDAKRLREGDAGPNTGGMGAYAPVHESILSKEQYEEIVSYVEATVKGLQQEGRRYKGTLYAGIMLTKDGPRFLEYNCRFGDPETEVVMPLLTSDLFEILRSCTNGTLSEATVKFDLNKSAVCIVAASANYPEGSSVKPVISVQKEIQDCQYDDSTLVFPAGVSKTGKDYLATGGRVLMVVGLGSRLSEASILAQRFLASNNFDGMQFRKDIGYQSISKEFGDSTALTYKKCSVDIDEGDRLVEEYIVPLARGTHRTGLYEGVGGFGGLFDLQKLNYKEPVLVSGTDGVGTKILIAEDLNQHEQIGIDLVAMSVNDILTHNAEPLFFLDYFATGKLKADDAGLVIKGIAEGCKQANCALIGGETAEMPGMYPGGRYDLAGFAVGIVEKQQILPKISDVKEGDVVIGIASSGIHSNGYSLVRKVVEQSGISFDQSAPFNPQQKLSTELLAPTKIYVSCLLPLLRSDYLKEIRGMAHITGGGLTENIPRILPEHLDAVLDCQQWSIPPVFSWLSSEGKVVAEEMARTFNLGIGMVLIVSKSSADSIVDAIRYHKETAMKIGTIVKGEKKVQITQLRSALISSWMTWAAIKNWNPICVKKKRIGILISGTGSNMEALAEFSRLPANRSVVEVVVVISNVPSAEGIEKARRRGIPVEVISHKPFSREEYDRKINQMLESYNVELVCLAGYMRICSAVFVEKWRGRCINTHPALLPAFKGKDAVQMALDERVRVSGCTVHFVEEKVDAGAIVLQGSVNVYPEDTHDSLQSRIKDVEHKIFPKAMEAVARQDVARNDLGEVIWKDPESYRKYCM
ncbi:trifunctional purine biosynthetic protein adenosine-3-like [Paramacrobiotus metropolitanus]|uniref:trifunctional purine biosynthetic protein adenosine-3-like n=1 Tax=Paramacrobiotus metropolitanus TaxID=2943436 RepID=UPI002445D1B0|nr:trifunctional purine biosynthetic protein adenosine-3-like [Paramacrobiotus metropolitanus]